MVTCVWAGAECLHNRLLLVGSSGLGARRKDIALGLEEKGRKERAAHWLLHTRGHRGPQRDRQLTS